MAYSKKGNSNAGRPPKWTSPEDMQKAIDEYFLRCEGTPMTDENGLPILNKYGEPVMLGKRPPTTAGLALHLGFSDRTSLLDYQERDEFYLTITRAKQRIEDYIESRLYDKEGSNGAKFALSCNFRRWNDKQEVSITSQNVNVTPADMDANTRSQMIAELMEKLKNSQE